MISLPRPTFDTPAESFDTASAPEGCDGESKPGVLAFRDFVIERLGGADLGIVRACGLGKPSDHHEGRAWDWGLDAANEDDQERAASLFDWLLTDDAELWRRAGLRYVIWDGMLWSTKAGRWARYQGPNPHTDHVHISLGWPGALAETSLYSWLGVAPPNPPPIDLVTPPGGGENDGSWLLWAALAGLTGVAAVTLSSGTKGHSRLGRSGRL